MSGSAQTIAHVARSKVGSRLWLYDVAKGDFGPGTNKCNLFAYDALVEAGVVPPPVVPRYLIFSRPPTAGEWADPSVKINGWEVVRDPRPGDVAAEAHNYSDATGHVGTVAGPGQTVSASAYLRGEIVLNDWGFRGDNRPTFRRFTR